MVLATPVESSRECREERGEDGVVHGGTTDILRLPHHPLLFTSVPQGILTVHRETLTQYITFERGVEGSLYSYTLLSSNVPSCIDASVRIERQNP
jgi:hypothetical protein